MEYKETEYLIFQEISTDKKTATYEVYSKSHDKLAVIKWYAPWRKFCFFPETATIFDEKCLEDIKGFIKKLMDRRKPCRCDCHRYPGTYRCEPCSMCDHHNSTGEWVGGINGYWQKTK